ncbi:MAG: methyltransferase domain-containing protein [Chloroflexi bacterium]|nr:methyltransferase domain-containing protein [Chloroflexota bacterium]
MKSANTYSDYDRFAWVYNKHWGSHFTPKALAVLDELVLPKVPGNARILDLCCGTGQLAQELSVRGYAVTGLDGSGEMLKFARENASAAQFILDDARTFRLPKKYDAVASMFDSLNHVMTIEELTEVFRSVHKCLKPGGIFLFDMNLEHGYVTNWKGHYAIIEDDHVCIFPNRYDSKQRIGAIDFTIFRLEDNAWWRSDLTLSQRCYSHSEILSALENAGFIEVRSYAHDQRKGLRPLTRYSNRGFFICEKPR